ncbi:MAG: PIN domain-containing protein [Nitrospira sp.]|nr:PIN domain-containing protein [Nitrospira sp.]
MPAGDLTPRLVDTSVWIRADRKGQDVLKARLVEMLIAGSVWICQPIRTELLIGVKTPERWGILDKQLSALEQAPLTDQIWERAARIGQQLARKGQSVPLTDLVIAATALHYGLTLWSVDGDVQCIQKVVPLNLDRFGVE